MQGLEGDDYVFSEDEKRELYEPYCESRIKNSQSRKKVKVSFEFKNIGKSSLIRSDYEIKIDGSDDIRNNGPRWEDDRPMSITHILSPPAPTELPPGEILHGSFYVNVPVESDELFLTLTKDQKQKKIKLALPEPKLISPY